MKKFIIILLLVLPIFLMVTISFAGRIFSTFIYIDVEGVQFVDEYEEEIESLKISKGEKRLVKIKVLPELANNKDIEFSSLNEDVAVISKDGVVEGVNYGFATILVKTLDGYKTDRLTINVTDEAVESIDIDLDDKTLYLYQSYILTTTIYPATALDKKVYWESSNSEYVSVDANGKITAMRITEDDKFVVITATTRDGAKVDSCKIKVVSYLLAFKPQIESHLTNFTSRNDTIDLIDFILYDKTQINIEDIHFEIVSGDFAGRIENKYLIFDKDYEGQPIKLKCYVNNSQVSVEAQIFVRYVSDIG